MGKEGGILAFFDGFWRRSCCRNPLEENRSMATREQKHATDLGEQAIALAEQLGRIAGTVEGTAESWLNRQTLTDQLTRVRDSATQMLEGLTAGTAKRRKAKRKKPSRAASARQSDPAHAPGKRRRKPAPTMKGVKKSDQRIPKMRTAAVVRQRRKSYL
jgi:hypothetical protein